jgi:large exoprotein involved in heme utilization and adhesion
LVELPQNVVEPSTLIAANPCTEGAGNEFTITGKGGVPANPHDALSSDSSQFNWVEPALGRSSTAETVPDLTDRLSAGGISDAFLPESSPREVTPAQGWVMNARGQVTLLAYNPTAQVPQRSRRALPVCRER